MRYRCDNCQMTWNREECPDVKDSSKRFDVGGPWTDKECPECGSLCYRLPAMKVRWQLRGSHVWAAVFMGEDIGHLACVGTLTMRPEEWDGFKETMSEGNNPDQCELHFEEIQDGVDMP